MFLLLFSLVLDSWRLFHFSFFSHLYYSPKFFFPIWTNFTVNIRCYRFSFVIFWFDLFCFFFFWLLYLRHAHITLIKLLLYLLFENLPLNFPVIFELSTVCLLPVVLTKRNGANFIFNFIFQVRFCLFTESIHLWIGFYCSTFDSFFFFFRAGNAERLHLN